MMGRDQKGLTLIELLVALAISGMLLTGLVAAIFQVIRHTDSNNTTITAVNQIEKAGRWIAGDAQMAQSTNLHPDEPAVDTLTLYWTDWTDWGDGYAKPDDFKDYSFTYSLSGTELQRKDNYNGTTTTVARFISDVEFSLSGGIITAKITSSPKGEDWHTEWRRYQIDPRPIAEIPLRY